MAKKTKPKVGAEDGERPKPLPKNPQIMWAVRLRASSLRPYFSTPLFAMHLVERPGLGTMATDQYGRIYVDTSIIGPGKDWSVQRAAWVMIHEIGHWLRKHFERAKPLCELEPGWSDLAQRIGIARAMNVCEDAELNDDLIQEGAELPGNCITPKLLGEQFKVKLDEGRLFEEYWAKLKKPLCERTTPKILVVDCGSVAHGVPGDYELPPPKGPNDSDTPGLASAEGDLIRRAVAREIQSAAARNPGTVPGGWQRWADTVLGKPQVPWERELAALARNAITMARGMVDYSYTRPSRRGNFNGVITAAMVRPLPEAGVVIDTSGSMSEEDLTAALAEVQGILRSVGQRKIPVCAVDAEVQSFARVSSAFQIELSGGGGTDMGVGIEHLAEMGCRVIIVLTDAATPWPERMPRGTELVIGVISSGADFEEWECHCPEYAKRVLHIPSTVAADEDAA